MKLLCDVFKSSKIEEMYLYVKKQEGLDAVPEVLLKQFGEPVHVMTFILNEEKTLARADTATVIKNLDDKGFYLQMPPQKEGYMQEINLHNSKLQ